MHMLVVLVMHVLVLVFEDFVLMFMLVPFDEMQPQSDRHQGTGNQQPGR
jgi:hypothetical protein